MLWQTCGGITPDHKNFGSTDKHGRNQILKLQ
jgi:hypothetical protein